MGAMAMAGPVTMAVLGAGARGNVCAGFAEQFPGRARVVAVADPRADRRDALADRLGVAADRRLSDWRDLAVSERLADAVIVTTPDREHAEAAVRFAGLGYHVLLEKPIAPTWAECVDVVEAAEKAGVILAVCHVMRYTAYTEAVKQVVAEGRLGQIVGVEHLEPVGWWHFAHAYVRGNWRRADQAGPGLLTFPGRQPRRPRLEPRRAAPLHRGQPAARRRRPLSRLRRGADLPVLSPPLVPRLPRRPEAENLAAVGAHNRPDRAGGTPGAARGAVRPLRVRLRQRRGRPPGGHDRVRRRGHRHADDERVHAVRATPHQDHGRAGVPRRRRAPDHRHRLRHRRGDARSGR